MKPIDLMRWLLRLVTPPGSGLLLGDCDAGLDSFADVVTDDGRQTPIDNPYLRGETER